MVAGTMDVDFGAISDLVADNSIYATAIGNYGTSSISSGN
jgi:hypothetical protein